MAFGGHFSVMSHIFPQLIQTAAVVVIQILMSDRACDVALRSSVLPCLWESEARERSQSDWFSGEVFIDRTAGCLPSQECGTSGLPQCHALAIAHHLCPIAGTEVMGTLYIVFIKVINTKINSYDDLGRCFNAIGHRRAINMEWLHFSGILKSAIRLWPLPTVPRPASDISVHAQVNEWEAVSKYCAIILHLDYTPKCRKWEMGVLFSPPWLVMTWVSLFLGVCGLFYITVHLVVLPVLSQSRCFISLREGGGFDLEARPSAGEWKNQYINDEKANTGVGRLNTSETCSQHPPPVGT